MRGSSAGIGPTRIRSDRRRKYVKILIDKFGNQCFYCTRHFEEDDPLRTLDHLTPLARGGSNLIENLVLCCRKCNNAKGDMLFSEYVDTEGYHQRRAWAIRQRTHPPKLKRRVEILRELVVI